MPPPAPDLRPRDLTLVFTDLVDSTQRTQALGEAGAVEFWLAHDRQSRALLARHGGHEIDRSDGFLLVFDGVVEATRFALGYQQAMQALAVSARCGLHHGPALLRENDSADVERGAKRFEVDGLAKPLAARVMSLARGGQTLLSGAAAAELARAGGGAATLHRHGHYRLKGIDEPVEIHELGDDRCAFQPPPDAPKAYRVLQVDGQWRPAAALRHNLAPERDRFIGRRRELRELARLLDTEVRLLTLAGPGGTGKTRLALAYARGWLGDWPGGAYFCDLSEATGIEGVCHAVAAALDVPLGKGDPVQQLGHAMASRGRCLLVLDNFEQLVACADATVGRWRDRCPEAAFVVTSRERLQLAGETLLEVEPLPLDGDAAELFVVRARSQLGHFEPQAQQRRDIDQIVRLLDGLPLALELAAARVRTLSTRQIVSRLRDRLGLLAGARGAHRRQATLRAAIDWSWQLLQPWEQALLAQCSVFEGGFTMEAAEAVLDAGPAGEAPPVLDIVQALLDKSLLRRQPRQAGRLDIDEPYFGMYLTIREFAAERLAAGGESIVESVTERHGRFYARCGSAAAIASLSRRGGEEALQALVQDLDNLIVACRRAVERKRAEVAASTYLAAWEVLRLRGPFVTAVELGQAVLQRLDDDHPDGPRVLLARSAALMNAGRTAAATADLEQALARARSTPSASGQAVVLLACSDQASQNGQLDRGVALAREALAHQDAAADPAVEIAARIHLAGALWRQSTFDASREHFERALQDATRLGNSTAEATILGNLGVWCSSRGAYDEARRCHERAMQLHRRRGDRRSEGRALINLGAVFGYQNHVDQARPCFEQALELFRDIGDRRSEGIVLGSLAQLCNLAKDDEQALAWFEAALAVHREVGNRHFEGHTLGNLGCLNWAMGRHTAACEALEAALTIHTDLGDRKEQALVLGYLAMALAGTGRFDAAHRRLHEAEQVLDTIDDPLARLRVASIRVDVELAAGARDAARVAWSRASHLARSIGVGPNTELGALLQEQQAKLATVDQVPSASPD